MWLTRLALRNPITILMLSLMTIGLGVVSFQRLSIDLFPAMTMPVVRIATFYSGAGPQDIEKTITEPIERAVSSTSGIVRIESNSRQGVSTVSAFFGFDANLDAAQFEVSQRVAQVVSALPPGVQQPFVMKFDITNIPVAQVAIGGGGLNELQLYDLAYNTIAPQIERLDGVASGSVSGGQVRQIEVKLRRDALRARGLAVLDVVSAVRASNLLLPSGNLRSGDRIYNVFTNTQVEQVAPLNDLIVRPAGAGAGAESAAPVRLRDVAEIADASADQNEIVRVNGTRGVFLRVLKQPGANTIAVVDRIIAALPNLRGLPPGVKASIAFDQSLYIRAAVGSLEREALMGSVLAILIILVFLASFRATGIIAVAIPLSIIATFMLLFLTGQSMNVFTLGGLALGVGRLVDDSIVELENIHRHFALGGDRKQALLAAAQEVAMPILVSTITTLVVFVPVLFLEGVARNLFVPLALTIAFSLWMSFLVSRTVTPLLCLRGLHVAPGDRPPSGFAGRVFAVQSRLDDGYARALTWVLRHRTLTIVTILALFGASLGLAGRIGTEFFPDSDESQISIGYRTPIGTRVEAADRVATGLEEKVRQVLRPTRDPSGEARPLYRTMITDTGLPTGRGALFARSSGSHAGQIQVNLVPPSQRTITDVEALTRVRAALRDQAPGTQLLFDSGGIVKRILNFNSSAPIDVEILGHDLDVASAYAKQLLARLREVRDADGAPWLTDLQLSREENAPELNVVVDREKAGVLGLSVQQIAQSVLSSTLGSTQFAPVPFTDPKTGNEYFINVRLDDPYRSRVSDLDEVLLRTPAGRIVALDAVARVERGSGPVQISRKYMQRAIDLTANVAPGKSLGEASAAVQAAVDDLPPPDGFTVQLSGQSAAQKEAFGSLRFASLLAILLVYMVLASQFRSLLHPLVIMFSVPMGITGVFVVLWATGTTLSVNSFMGIIMMVGIVISNGVLLIDFANVLRRRGIPTVEATIQAGRARLRPILMTTLTTVVGLVPMAVGFGEGSETNVPLARAVIGGLTISTVFTLLLVPALYTALDRFARPIVVGETVVEATALEAKE